MPQFDVKVGDRTFRVSADNQRDAWDRAQVLARKTTSSGAFLRGAVGSLLPATAGFTGAVRGAALGSRVGMLAGPYGVAAGGVLGALAGGLGGGYGADVAQRWALKKAPRVRGILGQSPEQRQADVTQHPYASTAGTFAPLALTLSPRAPGKAFVNAVRGEKASGLAQALSRGKVWRGVGAAFGGGGEALRQRSVGEDFDLGRIGVAAGAGALLQSPTRFGRRLGGPGMPQPSSATVASQTADRAETIRQNRAYTPYTPRRPPPAPPSKKGEFRHIRPSAGLRRRGLDEQASPGTFRARQAGRLATDFARIFDDVSAKGYIFSRKPGELGKRLTLEDIRALAADVRITEEQLRNIQPGTPLTAVEATAIRNGFSEAGAAVGSTAKQLNALLVSGRPIPDEQMSQFMNLVHRNTLFQSVLAGDKTAWGISGRAMQMTVQGENQAIAIQRMIASHGGQENIQDLVTKIAALDTPQAVNQFLQSALKATSGDMVLEGWINALLSGPQTHLVNAISNTLTAALSAPETLGAAIFSRIAGRRGEKGVYLGEAQARLYGMIGSLRRGGSTALKTLKTGMPSDWAIKTEGVGFQRIPGAAGRFARIPTRLLMASDDFFKTINYGGELRVQAFRAALKKGLQPRNNDFAQFLAEFEANPLLHPEAHQAATEAARYQTFTNPLTSEFAQSLQRFINKRERNLLGIKGPWVKMLVPFFRTPANIVKYAIERTPLAILGTKMRKDLLGGNGPRAADFARARMTMGSMIGGAVMTYALDGTITGGGPTDVGERNVKLASGWQPYSIKIGDAYYSYARVEPLAIIFGLAADTAESEGFGLFSDEESESFASLFSAAISKNLTSKTWLRGITSALDALSDPDRYGSSFINQLVGSAVPTGVAQFGRAQDPVLRDVGNWREAIQSRIPFLSKGVEPRRDIYGEPIELEGGAGIPIPGLRGITSAISPFYKSTISEDVVRKEVGRLGMRTRTPQRSISGVELTKAESDQYEAISGRLAHRQLTQFMSSSQWERIPDYNKQDLIQKAFSRARNTARKYLISQNRQLRTRIMFSNRPNRG